MSKLIIENKSKIFSDCDCLEAVSAIIKAGRISNHGKSYCHVATFKIANEGVVAIDAHLNKKSDRFVAYDVE